MSHGAKGAMVAQARDRSRRTTALVAAMGVIATLGLCATVASVGVTGATLAVLAATLPAIVIASIVLLFDRYEPEPRGLLALTFAFGATGAIAIALLFNWLGQSVATAALGMNAGNFVTTAAVAPLVEEVAKGVAVLVLSLRLRDGFNGVVDGLVYAVMVGLGFAFAENIMYYAGAMTQGQGLFASLVILRGGFSAFTHPLFTAMTGLGIALAAERRRARWVPAVVGLTAAMVLHAIWNGSTYFGGAFFLMYVGVFLPLLGIAIGIIWTAMRKEGQVLAAYLAPDVSAGLLTADEVLEMSSLARRNQMLARAYRSGGSAGRDARRAFQHAAAQLAFLRHRARPDAPDPVVEMEWVRQIARYKRGTDPAWVAPAGIGEF